MKLTYMQELFDVSPCTAGFVFETLTMGTQLNLSGEFDPALQPSKDGTHNGTVCHGNGWVEYARP